MVITDHSVGMEEDGESGGRRGLMIETWSKVHVGNGEEIRAREMCLHGNPVELVEHGSAGKILSPL